jgi:carboxyl-terminal processing protease
MTSRTRLLVLAISTPVIAFAIIGGFLGQAMTRDDAFQHLRVFQDVISLVLNNYVEQVDVDKAMKGAMNGLAEGLDADSAYLPPALVGTVNEQPAPADVGVELTRQYYLRVVSAREGSPAAKAGLRTGDYVRMINDRATRDMSSYEGNRLLHGAAGSKVKLLVIRGNAADPHEIELVREKPAPGEMTSRIAGPGTGYVRVLDFSKQTPSLLTQQFDTLRKQGAERYIIDLRGTARGDLDDGIAAARLFVKTGTLTIRQSKGDAREVVPAQASEATVTAPVVLLTDTGTAGAAEVFAAALDGNDRAALIGDRTLGRAGRQRLVKLPDGSGLWLTHVRYLTPKGEQIQEKGLTPDVEVDQPDVDFGAEPPATDATLEKALEYLAQKKAA